MESGYNLTKVQRKWFAAGFIATALIVLVAFVFHLFSTAGVSADPTDVNAFEPKVRAILVLADLITGAALLVAGLATAGVLWFLLDRTKLGERLLHFQTEDDSVVRAARIQAGSILFLAVAIVVAAVVAGVLK